MKLGGKGFLAFAQAHPDTPGKLLAHALSYEALERRRTRCWRAWPTRAGERTSRASRVRSEARSGR